jgi:prepilin-type N-terminal cleavage/methylation domain-containing protein
MKKGFTLVELAVASVVILVVLSALFIALAAFVRGGRTLELQDGALTLARVEIAEIEKQEETPVPGGYLRPDTLWGNPYTIETTVNLSGENAVDVSVAVTSGDSVLVELTRRFFRDSNTNQRRLI